MKFRVYELSKTEKKQVSVRLLRYRRINKNGCWLWTGFVNRLGYGWTSYKHMSYLAHRMSYMTFRYCLTMNSHNAPVDLTPDMIFPCLKDRAEKNDLPM